MRSQITFSAQRRLRAGFSLVEMLVVIALIALLTSLTYIALGGSGEAAREAATKTSIKILSGALRERIDAFHDITSSSTHTDFDVPVKLKTRVFRTRVEEFQALYANAGNPNPITPVQAEVFVRKLLFKSAFPQRLDDLYGYDGLAGRDDSPILTRMYSSGSPITGSWIQQNIDDKQSESSEMLYLVLTQGDVFGLPPADIDGIDNNLIGDTDGDGNLEFLDGWGKPLQFYNWPTRLLKDDGIAYTGTVVLGPNTYPTASLLISNLPLAGSTAAASTTVSRNRVDRDPEDITRALKPNAAPTAVQAPLLFSFNLKRGLSPAYAARPFGSQWYHDANTASMPLIVSAGTDGVLGLHLPAEIGTILGDPGANSDRLARVIHTDEACQALADNLTNQQRGPE